MTNLKKWLIIFGSALLAALLVWFGAKLATTTVATDVSNLTFFLLACAACFGGVFMLGTPGRARVFGAAILAIGLYYFARAGGLIEYPWLAQIFGFASILAAVVVVYVSWKLVTKKPPAPVANLEV